jgi:hypothetical protein
MRRPAVRLLFTLAISACAVGVIPTTTEAGIIPWAYDTVFGSVGSIQARQSGYYGGAYGANYGGAYGANYGGAYGANYGGCSTGCGTPCSTGYCGPAPRLFGRLRAWRMGYAGYGGYATGGGCCSTGGGYSNYGGVANYGGSSGCGISSCGGCSSCGGGGCGIDGGYGSFGGGCANGQCGVNYPPPLTQNNSGPTASSPVTPAAPPVNADAKAGGTQNDQGVEPGPMGRSGTTDGYQPQIAPGPGAGDGFRPRGAGSAAPAGGDPATGEFVPPVTSPSNNNGVDASPSNPNTGATGDDQKAATGTESSTPVVPPKKAAPKRNFGDEDEDKKSGTSVGPRFELNDKVTWRTQVSLTRQAPTAVRVSATVYRSPLFPKMAWRMTSEPELAKK